MSVPIVFVHLGNNYSHTLLHFSELARAFSQSTSLILVTDKPQRWRDFPGEVLQYSRSDQPPCLDLLRNRHPEISQSANGYWLKTIERFYALKVAQRVLAPNSPILHVESDVYLFCDDRISKLLIAKCKRVAVPRHSSSQAIASILFSPSLDALTGFLSSLTKEIEKARNWMSDMDLLGKLMNHNVIDELPSTPRDAWTLDTAKNDNSPNKVVFDGACFGQYLFGVDPIHSGGVVRPGFINEYSPSGLPYWKWGIECASNPPKISFCDPLLDEIFFVGNLHIHSKLLLPRLSCDSAEWLKFIATANSEEHWQVIGRSNFDRNIFSRFRDDVYLYFLRQLNKFRK